MWLSVGSSLVGVAVLLLGICGSKGNDQLRRAKGDDQLIGGQGDDRLIGAGGVVGCLGGPWRDRALGCETTRGLP